MDKLKVLTGELVLMIIEKQMNKDYYKIIFMFGHVKSFDRLAFIAAWTQFIQRAKDYIVLHLFPFFDIE